MSESPIFDGILEQARSEAESLLSKARSEADEILQEADAKASLAAQEEGKATRTRLEVLDMRRENAERAYERQVELVDSDAAYRAVMQEAMRLFDEHFRSPASRSTLVGWIAEAAYGLGQSEAKVSWKMGEKVDESMLREAEALLKEIFGFSVSLSLDEEHHTKDWGVMLSSLDDKVYFNNQLDVRLRRAARDIRKIIQESTCKAE